jgi:hypothetical protein
VTSRTSTRFALAALASLLLHAALMSGGWLRPPRMNADSRTPLEARLVPLAPAPPPAEVRATPPRAQARRERVHPPRRAPRAPPQPVLATPAPSTYGMPAPSGAETTDSLSEPAPASPAEVPIDAPASIAPAEPPADTPLRKLPRKGRITYTMYYGDDQFTVGKTVQTWEVDQDGYKLGSVSETTGIVELFSARRYIYLSEGRFTAHGLKPERFFMSRTRRGRVEAAQALFDWDAGRLTLGKAAGQHAAPLLPDAQDIVSFMYQLALSPPEPGRMQLPITNGSRFETYEIVVRDIERIETPLGVLRTLPIRQVARPGDESIAIWLAADYRYLPVKIRFFDREGRPTGEQVVDRIEISEE